MSEADGARWDEILEVEYPRAIEQFKAELREFEAAIAMLDLEFLRADALCKQSQRKLDAMCVHIDGLFAELDSIRFKYA